MKKLQKRSHFDLGESGDIARLIMRKTFTNIFITLADRDYQTIVCKTSGSSGIVGSKRRKRVPYAIENIMKELNIYFKLYNITRVFLTLKMRVNRFFYFLIRELAFYGIKVIRFYVHRAMAFNGVRSRKSRRKS